MNIGVLGFQGDVQEHIDMLKRISRRVRDLKAVHIRRASDLDSVNGLIIPGGESTTIYKLSVEYGLYSRIMERSSEGMPIMATCAGLILVSKNTNDDRVKGMGLLDVTIRRNAYGRQVMSFETDIDINGIGNFPAVFIRAPVIEDPGRSEVLGTLDGRPVIVRQNNVLGMTFHPELTGDTRVHEYFVNMVWGRGGYISTAEMKR
ncbi:pyridoxal 5'-phosphate synthase glutaminase subunit PdxT [Thermoplasma sp.]|uniref:pyridoxal 5'-phosphate synthase glutaminase subunit PdxT n=1 Tax=Thermoplasma sp. TaxID=1973142 RepID=UPI0012884F52|nr:pyridoxal 5'-phosphate synthase glutaminase subunit PdxT [Thermoplasma sp.]KAA8922031.1 MAG: pyridoxal 5'-phosphate synthase glutaminase subunit PdxT [Thermoplasma sp.]